MPAHICPRLKAGGIFSALIVPCDVPPGKGVCILGGAAASVRGEWATIALRREGGFGSVF
jgi:hypothetical protein